MGIYKAKHYFQGGWGKYRKINSFRIIGQGKGRIKNLCFIIFKPWEVEHDVVNNKPNYEPFLYAKGCK